MGNFKSILVIQFFLDFISSAYLILSSWIVYATFENASLTGIYVGLGFLPSVILNLYIGVFVDRVNTKKMIQFSFFIIILAIVVMVMGITTLSISLLFLTQMLFQIGGSIFRPSIQVYMTHLYPKEQLKYIFTKSASISILGGVIGTFISSQLISISLNYLFLILFIIVIAISLLSLKLSNPQTIRKVTNTSIHQDIRDGFLYIKTKPLFTQLFILLSSGQVIYHCTVGFLAAYTYELFTEQSSFYGYFQITLTIGGIIFGLLSQKIIIKTELAFSKYAFLFLSGSLVICFFSSNILFVGVSLFLIGMFTTWIRSHYQAVQQIHTDIDFNGKMASIRMILNQSSVMIFSPLLGIIGMTFGMNYVFGVLSLISLYAFYINQKLRIGLG